jgi:hypothetical protein
MMPPKTIASVAGLCLGIPILILVDLNLSVFADPHSIAAHFRSSFRTFPVYPWIIGVLLGHLYHPFGELPFRERLPWPWNKLVDPIGDKPLLRIFIAVVVSSGAIGLAGLGLRAVHAPIPAWILVLAGMLFGAFIWPTSSPQD